MKCELYDYCALYHPKAKKDQNGNEVSERSKLIIPVQSIVAATPDEVSIVAARAIPEEYLDKLDDVEIIVRPFAGA